MDSDTSLVVLGLPGIERAFDGLPEGFMRLGLRSLHQRLGLPLLALDGLDRDGLQDLWDQEWKEHGTEYDHITDALRNEDQGYIQQARLKWAVPAINDHIAESLGIQYLDYEVAKVQKRGEILKSDIKSLIISGGIGTGKTMALAWRCQALAMEKAVTQDYERIEDLLAVWPCGVLFNNLHKGLDVYENAAIMGIDDYGVEYVEPFALSQFELLVERRYARHLITIVTTNIPKASFKTRKGFERIESRLLKRCNWVEFIGEDRRKVLNGKETV